jgi:Fe-S-cluster containining protein
MKVAPFSRRVWRLELLPRPPAVEAADAALLAGLEETFSGARRRAGGWLVCREGCTECCLGPFPITQLDAWRLRRGLAALAAHDAPRASAVVARARAQVERLAPDFPGDPVTGAIDEALGEAAEEAVAERYASLPCPALDPETGRCDLYPWRPVSCRTFGPPVTIGEQRLPPCRLCFVGAPAAVVEACRVRPDADGLEDAILAELEEAGLTARQTTVAFALVQPLAPAD